MVEIDVVHDVRLSLALTSYRIDSEVNFSKEKLNDIWSKEIWPNRELSLCSIQRIYFFIAFSGFYDPQRHYLIVLPSFPLAHIPKVVLQKTFISAKFNTS